MFFWIQDGRISPRPPIVREPRVLSIDRARKSHFVEAQTEERREISGNLFQSSAKSSYGSQNKRETSVFFIHEIMTEPVFSLDQNITLGQALKELKKREIRHLPITDPSKKLIGFLSERDILQNLLKENENIELKLVMIQPVLVCKPSSEIRLVAKTLIQERIGCMPVVDEDLRPVGIVTRSDLLRLLTVYPELNIFA